MKTNSSFLSQIILMIFFSLIIMNVLAQDKNEGNRTKKNYPEQVTAPIPPAPPSAPTPPPPALEPLGDAPVPLNIPDLTEDQKAKISKLHLKQMESMTPLKNQVREKRARLETILTTTPVDMNAADVVAEDLGKIHTAILKLMIRHDQALRNLLTPDQQVIFDTRPKPFLRKSK
jgi:hypothetical protein